MRYVTAFAVIGSVITTAAAETQTPPQALTALAENGRYQLLEINDRVLRLDTAAGVFDQCGLDNGAWTCTPTQDRTRVLTEQIADLTKRVEILEAELAAQKAAREKGLVGRITDYVPGLK
jgi:hypothetical protein